MAEIGYIGENTDLILGQEFLTWLWFRSETGNVFRMEGAEHSGEPFTVAMEQRIVVRGGEGENQETATVVGSFSPLREARLGLLTGKQVVLTGCEPELFDGYGDCNRIYVEKGMARNV